MMTPTALIPTTDQELCAHPCPHIIESRQRARLRMGGLVLFLFIFVACASPPAQQPLATPLAPAHEVHKRPLSTYVPAVGLRWLVQLRPAELMAHPRFSQDWRPVFAEDRILAFTQASGADPQRIREAFIAGYDLGELYVFDGSSVGADAQKAFEARSLSTRKLDTGFDNLTHITGMIENTPHALVRIDDHLVAIAVGDIQLGRIVRAYAEGKLKKTPTAFEDRFLSNYESFRPDALVRAFLRGPYERTTDAVAAGFVAGAMAVSLQESELRLHARALGAWPLEADLGSRLTTYLDQLLSTRELRALGWGFPTESPEVSCEGRGDDLAHCSSEGAWNSAAVAQAVHRITAGNLAEIVGGAPPGWHPEATTRPEEEQPGEAPDELDSP